MTKPVAPQGEATPTPEPDPQNDWCAQPGCVARRWAHSKQYRLGQSIYHEFVERGERERGTPDPWISVEDHCPAPNSSVLFWTTNNCWESGIFRADEGEPIRWECERTDAFDERIDYLEGQVTHWMIPNPPGRGADGWERGVEEAAKTLREVLAEMKTYTKECETGLSCSSLITCRIHRQEAIVTRFLQLTNPRRALAGAAAKEPK